MTPVPAPYSCSADTAGTGEHEVWGLPCFLGPEHRRGSFYSASAHNLVSMPRATKMLCLHTGWRLLRAVSEQEAFEGGF